MNHSQIIQTTAKILLPFIIVFGGYVVINGADSVGGGFQGGAIISAAFIVRWIVNPEQDINLKFIEIAERVFLLALLTLGMLFLGRIMQMSFLEGRIWMISVNILIGTKVTCGLTIVFYRFVFFEGR